MSVRNHPRNLVIVVLAAAACWHTAPVGAQGDTTALIQQLQGPAGPVLSAADAATDYSRALAALLPDIGSDDLGKRAAAQQTWEAISWHAARPGADPERAGVANAMVAHLGADTPVEARLWLVKMLEFSGRDESVPALAGLLKDPDEHLRDAARRALENNSSPQAEAALVTALQQAATPDAKVAFIDALGFRKDNSGVAVLQPLLADPDTGIASAAADALGNIGTPDAVKSLGAWKNTTSAAVKRQMVNDLLRSAESLNASGQKSAAAAIYQQFYDPAQPEMIRVAALNGLAASEGEKAVPTLVQALLGTDETLRTLASQLFGAIPGAGATRAMADLLPRVPTAGQVLLLRELAHRADPAARGAVLAEMQSNSPEVRSAALQALGSVGTDADVAILAKTAAAGGASADAARASLASLRGDDVNGAMVAALGGSAPGVRVELVRALAARHATSAVPALVTAAGSTDAAVQAASLDALGSLGDASSLAPLVAILTGTKDDNAQQETTNALTAIINHLPDRTGGAAPILAALPRSTGASRQDLLGLLKVTGGDAALAAVRTALKDPNADMQDTAVRTLAGWPDASAAPDLLDIARTDASQVHRVLALRGYVRMAGFADLAPAVRVKMLQDALAAAQRPEEKRLALGGLSDVLDPAALKAAMAYVDDPALQEEAAASAVKIAKGLGGAGGSDTKPMMQKIIQVSKNADTTRAAAEVLNAAAVTLRGWHVVGPFPLGTDGFDRDFGPEKNADLNAAYPVAGGPALRWKPAITQPSGYVDLLAQLQPNTNVVAYALVYVKSPDARKAILSMGSDDGDRAWINGTQALANNAARPAIAGQDQAPINLKAGWNQVLVKITQGAGDWGYYFDILDDQKRPMTDLQYASQPEG